MKSNPIKTAPKPEKKVEMFIGYIDKSNTIPDLVSHMNKFGIIVDTSDIFEIPQRSDSKAFKVILPKSFVETLKVIWPKGVKVDKFKSKEVISAPFRSHNSQYISKSKKKFRKQPFRKTEPQGNYIHRERDNWRANTREWPDMQRSKYQYNNSWRRSHQPDFAYTDYPFFNTYY